MSPINLLKFCFINILESSTVSLTAGTEDPYCPAYRLWDRQIGLTFKPDTAETIEIKIDQGSAQEIDRLIIPASNNLAGMTLDIKYSDDDGTYTPAIAQWSGEVGLINKELTALVKRYEKFIITSPGVIPEISELFLTKTYTLVNNPRLPVGPFDLVFNVERRQTAGGSPRYCKHGEAKQRRTYDLDRIYEADRATLELLNAAWDGCKPFWMCDHSGTWIFGELMSPIEINESGHQRYQCKLDFMEVLP